MNTLNLPRRESLVSQTAAILRQELERGTWREWLPGERVLCDTLQISRNTLRSALALLQADGQVQPVHGSGNRILTRTVRKARRPKSRDVGLLTPDPLESLRPTLTLWIDELRALLAEQGCQLHVFHGRQYFRANPGQALTKLTSQHPHGCWVLALSNESTQRWFEKNVARCIVAGSVHPGLHLPYRDLDHRAMCRHAAGTLLRVGTLIVSHRLAGPP
ncbi:MAG: GntR family transcriptional regulator [Opitutaceae bacterium]